MAKKRQPVATVHDIDAVLQGEKKLKFHEFGKFNLGSVGVFVASKGTSPWEFHEDSDEFLQVLEGEVDVELLTETGSVVTRVKSGQGFVVPQAHWHRHIIPKFVKELYVTPGSTDHSSAEDPRATNGKRTKPAAAKLGKSLPEQIREYSLSFPETREDLPWGHPAFKVKNKMFVAMSFKEDGIRLTVKLLQSRLAASALPFVESTGYGLGEHGWITADLKPDETRISFDTIKVWIAESFRAVAPKTVLKEMDAAGSSAAKSISPQKIGSR